MSSDQKIAEIKRQLGEAVNRIETIQSGQNKPLLSRLATHFRTQSGSLINVVLTASIFAVAFGKFNQKQQHEVERADWQEQQQRLQLNHDRLSEEVSVLARQFTQLKAGVQRELDDGGFRLAPVKNRLQQMLADFSMENQTAGKQHLQHPSPQLRPDAPTDQPSTPKPHSVRCICPLHKQQN